MYGVTINPACAVVAFAVLIGASARVAVLLWQGKQIFPRSAALVQRASCRHELMLHFATAGHPA